MTTSQLEEKRDAIISEWGPWTAHSIQLDEGLHTTTTPDATNSFCVKQIVQLVADLTNRPFSELRILDLGCHEGMYAIELAKQGATVVGIEGREANIVKAKFASEVLGLGNRITWITDDARNVSPEEHGKFDVVLCLGLLYHLPHPDVFAFLKKLNQVCSRALIIDTHVAMWGHNEVAFEGNNYRGLTFVEHTPIATDDEKSKALWASLDNDVSFWPTRSSLINALGDSGFSSVFETGLPDRPGLSRDRITLAALNGNQVQLESVSQRNIDAARLPEDKPVSIPPRNHWPLFDHAQRVLLSLRVWQQRRGR